MVKDENKKKVLLALAIADGADVDSYEKLTDDQIKQAIKRYELAGLKDKVEIDEPITEQDIQKDVVEATAKTDKPTLYKIVNVGDGATCPACKEWIGKIVTTDNTDTTYPSVDDFINSGGLHPNCRCSLQELTVGEIPRKTRFNSKPTVKELKTLAMNSKELQDKIVYRGFVDDKYDPDIEYNFDETLVMICPKGEFYGSDKDGNPIVEKIDEDSLILMEKQTEEILLDRDHNSMKPIGMRDTTAYGWISGLKAITDLGDMDGLYGIIKWTGDAIKLAKERIYRFLSPVFELDENNRAVKLINVALTNRPALPVMPIINGEPEAEKTISITQTLKDTDNMNKDEIEKLIVETVSKAVDEKLAAKPQEEAPKEEVKNEEVPVKEEAPVKEEEAPAKEEAPVKEEAKNEDVHIDVFEEKKEDKPEVIKEEALNSAPVVTQTEPWRNLRGQAFFDYLAKHPELH